MVIMLKGNTKRGQNILSCAERNIGTELYDVYTSCSEAKRRAYAWCREQYYNDNASYGFHICSKNTNMFTVSWNFINELTGEVMTRYETNVNTYIVDGSM